MSRHHKYLWVILCAFILVIFSASPQLQAQDHVVPESTIHQALVNSATTRQNNITQVEKFFSSQPAQAALKKGRLNLRQVENAIPSLDNQELAQLAKRTQKIQNDFAAGSLSNERLTYIVIALATAVIVILLFEA
ncbi:MAG: hypothetical protein ACRD18_16320 [Terriglobia bacterium]